MTHHKIRHLRLVFFSYIVLLCLGISVRGGAVDIENAVETGQVGCVDVAESEVDRIMGLELKSSTAGGSASPRSTRLAITCTENGVILVATDRVTGERSERRIPLTAGKDSGKERLIALAAVELILPLWEQLTQVGRDSDTMALSANDDSPTSGNATDNAALAKSASARNERASDAKAPRTDRREVSSTRAQKRMHRDALTTENDADSAGHNRASRRAVWGSGILLSATGYMYPVPRLFLAGGELSVNLVRNDFLEILVGGGAVGGRITRDLGRTRLLWVNAALMLGIRKRLLYGRLLLKGFLGFRGGYGQLTGMPQSPFSRGHQLQGMVGGPALRLTVSSGRRSSIGVSLEGGHTIWGIEGYVENETDITLAGWWTMVSVDLSILFQKTGATGK